MECIVPIQIVISLSMWRKTEPSKKHCPFDCQIALSSRASGRKWVCVLYMYEVICWLFKLQIALVFDQHLVSYVPGKFLHQATMNLYKDIKEMQEGQMVSTYRFNYKIKQVCNDCK